MKSPPSGQTWTEAERLAALRAYGVLDSDQEPAFDEIAALLQRICDVPIALVSLVDEGRQWFKARVGLDASETPRDVSFCAHAVAGNENLVVPDALSDPRFADNPLVTGPPHIRFYAGAVLRSTEGLPLGSLCVIDTRPRPDGLDATEMMALEVLSRQVMVQLELRRALTLSGRQEADLATALADLRLDAQAREVLSQELSHRVKNVFAVVSALVALSARQHPEARDFADSLRTRIQALARAHEFVRPHPAATLAGDGATTLHAFLRELLAPYGSTVEVCGDDAVFDDQAATPVALLFHELATNAAKYGALSRDGGRIEVLSRLNDGGFSLIWRESGGPVVVEPERLGFGTTLVNLAVEGQLGGKLDREWSPEGLMLTATLPVSALSRRKF